MQASSHYRALTLTVLTFWGMSFGTSRAEETGQPKLPDPIPVDGFQQLLPVGAIAALVDPAFVPATEAEIPDSAWVLGFAHGGEAYAYDLNLLNSHEVVNHQVAGSLFAAVW